MCLVELKANYGILQRYLLGVASLQEMIKVSLHSRCATIQKESLALAAILIVAMSDSLLLQSGGSYSVNKVL